MSTAMAATILAHIVLAVLLGGRVAALRIRLRVGIGEGKEKDKDRVLRRAIRVHGNFAEWAPFALLAILAADLRGVPETWVWGLGGTLLVARLGHATGLSRHIGVSVGRTGGTILTMLTMLTAATMALLAG